MILDTNNTTNRDHESLKTIRAAISDMGDSIAAILEVLDIHTDVICKIRESSQSSAEWRNADTAVLKAHQKTLQFLGDWATDHCNRIAVLESIVLPENPPKTDDDKGDIDDTYHVTPAQEEYENQNHPNYDERGI